MQVRFLVFLAVVLLLSACDTVQAVPTLPPPTLGASNQLSTLVIEEGSAMPGVELRETPIASSSPTPINTPTRAPMAIPTERSVPDIDPAQMPTISHDLLFLEDGRLKRWQQDGRIITLVDGDVVNYALSEDGKHAVVAQLLSSTEISNAATVKTYAVNYVNLETGESKRLIPNLNNFGDPHFQLSQDGKHLAVSGLGLGDPNSLILGEEVMTELYVVETESGQLLEKMGDCARVCQYPVWHHDNKFFVYGDDAGLFLRNLAGEAPELLLSGDNDSEFDWEFAPISWAKNGRWLLLYVDHALDGRQHAIFDVPTRKLMMIPHTDSYDGFPYADVTWMQDDRLFMVRHEGDPVVGETWRVNMDAGAIQRDESVILFEEFVRPWAPVHWKNGRFGYGLLNMERKTTELFQRVALGEPAQLMNTVPEAAANLSITWTPDASGAVVEVDGHVYYAPANGELVDLTTAVNLRGQNFTWLP